jgi:hypothetical protein
MNALRVLIPVVLLATGGFFCAEVRADCTATTSWERVFSEPEDTASWSVRWCIQPAWIRTHVRLAGLEPGDVYSVWWAYFDDPARCAVAGECGYEDLVFPEFDPLVGARYPVGEFGRLGSAVAGMNGTARFTDVLNHFSPAPGSELWLVVLGHGPAEPLDDLVLARQLLTPENFNYGASFLGNDADGIRTKWLAISRQVFDPASGKGGYNDD